MSLARAAILSLGIVTIFSGLPSRCRAQGAVGFFPVVGSVPDGVIMDVTPVVTADRRYVRLSLNASFISNVRFDTFFVPAAVSGGGIGGGFGGFGGGGGGLGGGLGGIGGGLGGFNSMPGGFGFGPTPNFGMGNAYGYGYGGGSMWGIDPYGFYPGTGYSLGLSPAPLGVPYSGLGASPATPITVQTLIPMLNNAAATGSLGRR